MLHSGLNEKDPSIGCIRVFRCLWTFLCLMFWVTHRYSGVSIICKGSRENSSSQGLLQGDTREINSQRIKFPTAILFIIIRANNTTRRNAWQIYSMSSTPSTPNLKDKKSRRMSLAIVSGSPQPRSRRDSFNEEEEDSISMSMEAPTSLKKLAHSNSQLNISSPAMSGGPIASNSTGSLGLNLESGYSTVKDKKVISPQFKLIFEILLREI